MITDVFTNYGTNNVYNYAKEFLMKTKKENGKDPNEVTEEEIWEKVGKEEKEAWEVYVKENLINFFSGKTVIMKAAIERWNGKCKGAKIGDFGKLLQDFLKDCDYVHIYDKDGHLFINTSHNDGTNEAEVRILTEKGIELYKEWWYCKGPFNNLSEREIHQKIMRNNSYSVLPKYELWEENFGKKIDEQKRKFFRYYM